MPSKKQVQKNRYCKNCKLSEADFEALLYFYFDELIFNYSRKDIVDKLLLANTPIHISLPTIAHYFEKIGEYIWDRFVSHKHPALQEEDVFDELVELIYGRIDEISAYRDFYNSLEDTDLNINADNITGSLMFLLLSKRAQRIKGFKNKEKFYLEFSRAYFICVMIEVDGIYFESIYDAPKTLFQMAKLIPMSRIAVSSLKGIKYFLKRDPM